jgi:hypothetical protein
MVSAVFLAKYPVSSSGCMDSNVCPLSPWIDNKIKEMTCSIGFMKDTKLRIAFVQHKPLSF